MKKAIILALIFVSSFGFAQEKETSFEREGNLVKATYYNAEGQISIIGYFKDKKITGTWTSYDTNGNKTKIAHYKDGKKVGKWFVWNKNTLKEITYNNNLIVSVNDWKSESRLALNND